MEDRGCICCRPLRNIYGKTAGLRTFRFCRSEGKSMQCKDRKNLEQTYCAAETALEAAREELRARIATTPKEEFLALNQAADLAHKNHQQARNALHRHIREHGCAVASSAFF